jgi:hypothetical protein
MIALAAPNARSQAPLVLTAPASTRALGVGDAYAALASDPDAIFYNPAQLLAARGLGAGAQRYGDAATVITVSAASVLAPGTMGLGVHFLDHATAVGSYGELARAGSAALIERGARRATGGVVSVGYARTIFNVRVGAASKIIYQEFGEDRDATPAFDVGITGGSSYPIALVGRNLGHGIALGGPTQALPREVVLGGAMPRREVGPLDLAATAAVAMRANGVLHGGGGTEWSYNPLDGFTFAARIGYRAVEGAESHVTFGAGFVGERFNVDYAYGAIDGDGMHRFGVRWR